MDSSSRYLRRLAEEAGKSLPAFETASLVAEARAHLEDSIQARLELGFSPEEAERQAVAAFGASQSIVREIDRHHPWIESRFLRASLLVLAYWTVVQSVGSWPSWATLPVMALFVAVHGLYLRDSVRSRRIQVLPLGLVLLPLGVLWATRNAARDVVVDLPEGPWVVRYDPEALGNPSDQRAFAVALRAQDRSLRQDYARFVRGEIATSPPRSLTIHGVPYRLTLHRDGVVRWHEALLMSADGLRVARNNERLAERLETPGNPWWRAIPYEAVETARTMGWSIAAAYFGLHAWGWALGFALRKHRGLPPRVPFDTPMR